MSKDKGQKNSKKAPADKSTKVKSSSAYKSEGKIADIKIPIATTAVKPKGK